MTGEKSQLQASSGKPLMYEPGRVWTDADRIGLMAPISTLGELRHASLCTRPVKQEVRDNLVRKLQAGEQLFPGIIGYDETVIPQLVNAILSRHNFILLGLRGH